MEDAQAVESLHARSSELSTDRVCALDERPRQERDPLDQLCAVPVPRLGASAPRLQFGRPLLHAAAAHPSLLKGCTVLGVCPECAAGAVRFIAVCLFVIFAAIETSESVRAFLPVHARGAAPAHISRGGITSSANQHLSSHRLRRWQLHESRVSTTLVVGAGARLLLGVLGAGAGAGAGVRGVLPLRCGLFLSRGLGGVAGSRGTRGW